MCLCLLTVLRLRCELHTVFTQTRAARHLHALTACHTCVRTGRAMENGGAWGGPKSGVCKMMRKHMKPDAFAYAHEAGCPCDCPDDEAAAAEDSAESDNDY